MVIQIPGTGLKLQDAERDLLPRRSARIPLSHSWKKCEPVITKIQPKIIFLTEFCTKHVFYNHCFECTVKFLLRRPSVKPKYSLLFPINKFKLTLNMDRMRIRGMGFTLEGALYDGTKPKTIQFCRSVFPCNQQWPPNKRTQPKQRRLSCVLIHYPGHSLCSESEDSCAVTEASVWEAGEDFFFRSLCSKERSGGWSISFSGEIPFWVTRLLLNSSRSV